MKIIKNVFFVSAVASLGLIACKQDKSEQKVAGIVLENKQDSETLFFAINQLPEAQRVVFTLHKVDGKSYKEVSEITNKSLSSVESLMFRSKKNLQKLLENFYKNNN